MTHSTRQWSIAATALVAAALAPCAAAAEPTETNGTAEILAVTIPASVSAVSANAFIVSLLGHNVVRCTLPSCLSRHSHDFILSLLHRLKSFWASEHPLLASAGLLVGAAHHSRWRLSLFRGRGWREQKPCIALPSFPCAPLMSTCNIHPVLSAHAGRHVDPVHSRANEVPERLRPEVTLPLTHVIHSCAQLDATPPLQALLMRAVHTTTTQQQQRQRHASQIPVDVVTIVDNAAIRNALNTVLPVHN
jgi:hypothetical protein